MSKYLSLIIVAFMLSVGTYAQKDYAALWQKANNYYTQKNYDSALANYKSLAAHKPHNAEVYYNLGNTYYRLNDIGNAVLNYERALHLQPSYKEASDNLYLTQNRINNRIQQMPEIFFVQWWKSLTRPGLANAYAITAILLFILIVGYHIGIRLKKIAFKLPTQLSVALVTVAIVFIILGLVSGNRMANPGIAVVMTEGAPMMAEPKHGKSLSLIPEGTTVETTGTQADWCEIKLPDGRTGWVQQNVLERI